MFAFNKQKGRILFTMLFLAAFLGAEQIESIQIKGLKRTKEDTLLHIIDISPGDVITPDLTGKVEQRLRKAGLFQEEITVDLLPGGEGQILSITAYDRWTLIGIPFFAASSGDMRGGLFVMDSNLGGKGNFLVSSLLLSQGGDLLAFLMYRDSSLFDSDYSGSARISGGRASVSYTSLDGEETWESYYTDYFTLGIGGGIQPLDRVEMTLSLAGTIREDLEDGTIPPSEGEGILDLTLEGDIRYDGTTALPLFYRGLKAQLGAETLWEATTGENSLFLSGEVQAGWAAASLFHIQGTGKAGMTNDSFHSLYRLGGSTGSLTLPSQTIAVDRYANGELKGELRLAKMKAGYLTAPLYYEAGYLRDYYGEDQFYQGAGGGIRFYMDKVAIPALGLDYRYNVTTETGGVSFFMGMSY